MLCFVDKYWLIVDNYVYIVDNFGYFVDNYNFNVDNSPNVYILFIIQYIAHMYPGTPIILCAATVYAFGGSVNLQFVATN